MPDRRGDHAGVGVAVDQRLVEGDQRVDHADVDELALAGLARVHERGEHADDGNRGRVEVADARPDAHDLAGAACPWR